MDQSWWMPMKLIRYVRQAEMIPRFYGVCYAKPWQDVAICLPVPLNLVWRWIMRLWWLARNPSGRDFEDLYHSVRQRMEKQYRGEITKLTLDKQWAMGQLEGMRDRIAELEGKE